MLSDSEYFSHLYEIASCLNKEFSMHSALKKALEKTVQLLELETGWIWLMQGDNSVYLAASYNLPPALKDHPERLSGKCFCIEKYLSNNIDKAKNISEIACSRLKNITAGTSNLKFHATIPINIGNQKVGLINLLTRESQQLNEKQLAILNTISELVAMFIQRTHVQDAFVDKVAKSESPIQEALDRVFHPRLKVLINNLEEAKTFAKKGDLSSAVINMDLTIKQAQQLSEQLSHISSESSENTSAPSSKKDFHYPSSPLTERELELLALVKKGFTNKQIADTLFISERTVKFHITSILSKLFANTRTEAVDIALKRGLISF